MKKRCDGRRPGQLRPLKLTKGYLRFAPASCLVEWGNTKLICTATVEERVPRFLLGKGTGWVTGEYAMLPRSSTQRIERESLRGRPSGRTQEIQRLIGRSLRSVIDLSKIGERTILIDCDVLQADGGTRCAAITGGFVALALAVRGLRREGLIERSPLKDFVAAVSVGVCDGKPALDLDYGEDSTAEVDMNLVMTGRGRFVELQGTAEGKAFGDRELKAMLVLGKRGVRQIVAAQKRALRVTAARRI